MSAKTKIEWTRGEDGTEGATWNPTLGCSPASPGCDRCYAVRTVNRMAHNPNQKVAGAAAGLVERGPDDLLRWTGKVNLLPDRLTIPLRWRKGRRIFVDSQSDLFHPDVPDEFIARVWAVMAATPQHQFQVLTKRHGRMRSLLNSERFPEMVGDAHTQLMLEHARVGEVWRWSWPLPGVWVGVSVEDQQRAELRIPALMDTPAAVRFLSCEPLLSAIDLSVIWTRGGTLPVSPLEVAYDQDTGADRRGIDWSIIGGESGRGARPCDLEWIRGIVAQCRAAGVPAFVKQMGSVWASHLDTDSKGGDPAAWPEDLRIREFPAADGGETL